MKKIFKIILIVTLWILAIGWMNSDGTFSKLLSVILVLFLLYQHYKDWRDSKEIKDLKEQANKILEIEKMDLLEAIDMLKEKQAQIKKLDEQRIQMENIISDNRNQLNDLKSKLVIVNEELDMESFSLYKPRYDFANSSQYKNKLEDIRNQQKQMIKNKTAVHYFDGWTVDGSKSKGRKMTNDNIKIILRNFNADCEAAINKIKFNNLQSIEKRILNSFAQLNKLNETNRISITDSFLNLKMEELHLGYEYERQLEIEKDILREQREREREERRALAEIERKKASIDKEIIHYQTALNELENKILTAKNEDEIKEYNNKIMEINENIEKFKNEKEELDYRIENVGAGYVYIISNIGAFGENVFKIGVTRRLNPIERIMELSSASVPFKFDIHALIFSYNAYELETELHTKFTQKRVNLVNNRKEFFNITIEEIEEVLDNYKELTFEFNKIPDADEYRETLKMREKKA